MCPDRAITGLWAECALPVLRARQDCQGADCQGHCQHCRCLREERCRGSSVQGSSWALAQELSPSCLCIFLLNRPLLFSFLWSSVPVPRLARSPLAFLYFALDFLTLFFFFLATAQGGRATEGPSRRNIPHSSGRAAPGHSGSRGCCPN